MKKTLASLALVMATSLAGADVQWMEYDADSDIKSIDDGIAFGMAPDLVLKADSLKGAQILYGNPTVIKYQDGSAVTLKRYTKTDIEQEYNQKLGTGDSANTIQAADIPAIMLQYNTKPSAIEYDNKDLIKALQDSGKRLLQPLADRSERFVTQRYTTRLWFVLGEKESIGFITNTREPDQYVMVRGDNIPKSEFLARVVRGALQPQGSEQQSEQREIPRQHMIPLPK